MLVDLSNAWQGTRAPSICPCLLRIAVRPALDLCSAMNRGATLRSVSLALRSRGNRSVDCVSLRMLPVGKFCAAADLVPYLITAANLNVKAMAIWTTRFLARHLLAGWPMHSRLSHVA